MALRVPVSGICMAAKPPSSSSSAIIGSQAASPKVGGIRVAHPSTTRCSITRMNYFPNAKSNANVLNITFEDQAADQLKMLEKAVREMIEDLFITCQVTASDTAVKLKSKAEKLPGEVENYVKKIRLIKCNIQATTSQMDSIEALKQSSKTNKTLNEILEDVNVTETLATSIKLEKTGSLGYAVAKPEHINIYTLLRDGWKDH